MIVDVKNSSPKRTLCANNCGQKLSRNHIYCSMLCKVAAYRDSVIQAHYAETLKPSPFFNRIVRRHLLETLGEFCQRCGWKERNPYSGKVPVEIEHIDGNWRNIAPSNLTVLCPNCHSLTKSFRGLNRGHGRPGRPGTSNSEERITSGLVYPLRPLEGEVSFFFAGQRDLSEILFDLAL